MGSVDAVTANQENGALVRGDAVPVEPWYDHAIHVREHIAFMKDRRFLQVDPAIRQAFMAHVQAHEQLALQMGQMPSAAPPPEWPTAPLARECRRPAGSARAHATGARGWLVICRVLPYLAPVPAR